MSTVLISKKLSILNLVSIRIVMFWNIYGNLFGKRNRIFVGEVDFVSGQCAFPNSAFYKENFG
jgi:hypothetical protein